MTAKLFDPFRSDCEAVSRSQHSFLEVRCRPHGLLEVFHLPTSVFVLTSVFASLLTFSGVPAFFDFEHPIWLCLAVRI